MDKNTPVFGTPAPNYSAELQHKRGQFEGGGWDINKRMTEGKASIGAYDYAVIQIAAALAATGLYGPKS